MDYEKYDYNHMAYMAEIKLLVIKAYQYLENPGVCSKEEAMEALEDAIHRIVNEENNPQ